MTSFYDADATSPEASNACLSRCGFTDAQAVAVMACVGTAIDEAVEALRYELARWHAYLALYLLAQIGIVLLAGLIITDPTLPRPTAWNAERVKEGLSGAPKSRLGTASECLDSPNLHRFEDCETNHKVEAKFHKSL